MKPTTIISQLGNAFIIAASIFIGIWIFYLFSDDTTVGARMAYAVIFTAAIFTLLYTFKLALIWLIRAMNK